LLARVAPSLLSPVRDSPGSKGERCVACGGELAKSLACDHRVLVLAEDVLKLLRALHELRLPGEFRCVPSPLARLPKRMELFVGRLVRERLHLLAELAGLSVYEISTRLTTRGGDLQAEAEAAFASITPPDVEAALAVGGSARAARRLVGPELGPAELAEAIAIAEKSSIRELGRRYDIDRARAQIVPAGLALLAEVPALLCVPLHVCSGGLREGAAIASLDALAA